jgi:hypothetical protein
VSAVVDLTALVGARCALCRLRLADALERRMALAVRRAGLAIDAVQYGIRRPGATSGEHRLPTLAP